MFIEGIVKKCFEDLSKNFVVEQKRHYSETQIQAGSDTRLISKLETEIEFLREEMRNKNKIIEVLVSDRNLIHTHNTHKSFYQTEKLYTHTENPFQFPKRHAHSSKTQPTKENNYTHENKYDALFYDDTFNNDNDDELNDSQDKDPNMQQTEALNFDNVTERKNQKIQKKKADGNQQKKRYVAIVGDSIVKEVKGHFLSTKKENVVVKTFSGATAQHMYDYVKPTLEMEPDQHYPRWNKRFKKVR